MTIRFTSAAIAVRHASVPGSSGFRLKFSMNKKSTSGAQSTAPKNTGAQVGPARTISRREALKWLLGGTLGATLFTDEFLDNRKIKTLEQRLSELENTDKRQNQESRRMEAASNRLTQRLDQAEATDQQQEHRLTQVEASNIAPDVIRDVVRATLSIRGPYGDGAGVFISEDGYILTQAHLVAPDAAMKKMRLSRKGAAARYTILPFGTWPGGTAGNPGHYTAKLVKLKTGKMAWDPVQDLALLKITDKNHKIAHYLPLDRFRDTRKEPFNPGEPVVIVGNPLDYEDTVTAGKISHYQRLNTREEPYPSSQILFQMDAACNPGNSGGGVFDRKGRLAGIQNSTVPDGDGMCFATQSNSALDWMVDIGFAEHVKNKKP